MAELVESSENSSAVHLAANKAKLQALERQLGIDSSSSAGPSVPKPSISSGSGTMTSTTTPVPTNARGQPSEPDAELVKLAQKRKKFDDDAHFETSREINDGVRSAVAAGESGGTVSCLFVGSEGLWRMRMLILSERCFFQAC